MIKLFFHKFILFDIVVIMTANTVADIVVLNCEIPFIKCLCSRLFSSALLIVAVNKMKEISLTMYFQILNPISP